MTPLCTLSYTKSHTVVDLNVVPKGSPRYLKGNDPTLHPKYAPTPP